MAYPNTCPTCGAAPERPCRSLTTGRTTDTHKSRITSQHDEPETCPTCGVELSRSPRAGSVTSSGCPTCGFCH